MKTIRFAQSMCADLHRASKLEWLETNGLGGFASSTIAGLNTRRYHGLLTAATKPPVGRMLLLSKLEETLIMNGQRVELSVNQYPGAVHPSGFQYLREFRLDPFPISVYHVDGIDIEKRVFMVQGENTTVIEYRLLPGDRKPPAECTLEVRPLIAFRDYHSTTHCNSALNPEVESSGSTAAVTPYADLPSLFFSHNAASLEGAGGWYYNFEYKVERERGLDFREDLFNPLLLRFHLSEGAAVLIASTSPHDPAAASQLQDREIARRKAIIDAAPLREPIVEALAAAADHYIVERGELKTIVAGYHWFTDWGRDTMIALPGLTLVTGRFEIAAQILRAFAESVDRGMLPNRFLDAGETAEYNTADATLWFFETIRAYLRYTNDFEFVHEHLYGKLKDIMDWHIRGTRYGIGVDSDGLLRCGEEGTQLTWMDAKIGDFVVTPRAGKPVEIQALWYNALRIMEDLTERFSEPSLTASFRDLADRAAERFNAEFWNEDANCLFDVVDENLHDGSLRPNQIFAVSLPHSMLAPERARQVVDLVERELLTPIGLRSLARYDPRYRPRCEGGVNERDSAYHQGTVWPWLMGPFLTAYLRVHAHDPAARKQAAAWLEGFQVHLATSGLGHISEIADAEDGNEPRGCIAQAWSVAELLRAAVEDVYRDAGVGDSEPASRATMHDKPAIGVAATST